MRNPLENNFKVRFHLGHPNKGFWRIQYKSDEPQFYNPEKVHLILKGCFLRNQQGSAKKIFKTHKKTVCAWIECQQVFIVPHVGTKPINMHQIEYNPHLNPHYLFRDEIVDYQTFDVIKSHKKRLYAKVQPKKAPSLKEIQNLPHHVEIVDGLHQICLDFGDKR